MIKIENTETFGWEASIRGMRNPMNSWDKMDSDFSLDGKSIFIGPNDMKLMKRLSSAGPDHGKFLRMITVMADITAPQFWWYEFDTYKIGTVRNSCSKMHKIHIKPFNYEDFTHEGIDEVAETLPEVRTAFQTYIDMIEWMRVQFNNTQEKKYWRALIELLPSGYNMKATIQINYQVGKAQHSGRRYHKLTEWHDYCDWLESLPYFKEIVLLEE